MSGIRSGRARTIVLAVAVAVATGLGSACGVSTDEEPQPIARENVPSELLEPDAATAEEDAVDGGNLEVVPVWFLLDDGDAIQLHAVERGVPWPAQAAARIDALLDPAGPTEAERRRGISTAVPTDARLTALPTQDGSVLEVSLSDDFYELRGESAERAVAQLVFTATEISTVEAVRFVDQDGQRIEVPDGDGQSRDEPVGREDYENLDPAPG